MMSLFSAYLAALQLDLGRGHDCQNNVPDGVKTCPDSGAKSLRNDFGFSVIDL